MTRAVSVRDDLTRLGPAVYPSTGINDTSKALFAPRGTGWEVSSVRVTLATTAAAGDRRVALEVLNEAGVVAARYAAGVGQAASLTRGYTFAPGAATSGAFRGAEATVAMPRTRLTQGMGLRAVDLAAVAPTTDDMTVHVSADALAPAKENALVSSFRFVQDASVAPRIGPAITFTRSSTATYFDRDGALATAAADAPRLEYDPSTGAVLGLLVENAATNLNQLSEAQEGAGYNRLRMTVSPDTGEAPDLGQTMNSAFETADTNTHHVDYAPGIATTAALVYFFSAFVRKLGRRHVSLAISDTSGGNLDYATFDLDGGGAVAESSAGCRDPAAFDCGGGTYRLSMGQAVATTATRGLVFSRSGAAGSPAADLYAGDVAQGFMTWGWQFEQNARATSYVPTPAAASATRARDVARVLGASLGAQRGAMVVGHRMQFVNTTQTALAVNDGTFNNEVQLEVVGVNMTFRAFVGGSTTMQINLGVPADGATRLDAATWEQDSAVAAAAGAQAGATVVSGNVPTPTTIVLGATGAGTSEHIHGHLRSVDVYNQRLTTAEVAALTDT